MCHAPFPVHYEEDYLYTQYYVCFITVYFQYLNWEKDN